MKKVLFFLVLTLSLSVSFYAQEAKTLDDGAVVGKLFTVTKAEAKEQFGEVVKKSVVSKSTLLKLAENSGEYLMFGFVDDECGVYDEFKNILFGFSNNNELDLYYVYSTSKIIELLESTSKSTDSDDDSDEVVFELRDGTITITYNGVVLENSFTCPPYC